MFSIALTVLWAVQLICLHGRAWPLFIVLLLLTGVIPLVQSVRAMKRKGPPSPDDVAQLTQYARLSAWLSKQRPWVTGGLLGCIVTVFGWQLAVGLERSVVAAGLLKPYVADGEYWRLLTGGLCHGSVLHLILNGIALAVLSILVEAFAGKARLIVVFLLSIFAGSVCSYYLLPNAPSVGASGGILGLQGFLAVLAWRHRRVLPQGFLASIVRPVILLGLAGVVAVDYIDNAIHAGGLLAGMLLGAFWVPGAELAIPMPTNITAKILGVVAAILLFVGVEMAVLQPAKTFDTFVVLCAKAHRCYMKGDYRGAIECYTAALKIHPSHADSYDGRGAARACVRDLDGALADCSRAIDLDPTLKDAYVQRSAVLAQMGNWDGAFSDVEAVLRIDPMYAKAYSWWGDLRLKRGDKKGAMENYNVAIKADPRCGDAYVSRALLRDLEGDIEGSFEDINTAISLNPRDPYSYPIRAWVYYEKGDIDAALKDCETSLAINPGHADSLNMRGLVRAAKGDAEGALVDYTGAIRADPQHLYAYASRGNLYLDRGNLDAALRDYEEELKVNPESADAFWGRGRVRASRKDTAGARADYQKVLLFANPGWKGKADVEEALRQLEDDGGPAPSCERK